MPDLAVFLGWLLVGWFCGTPPSPVLPPSPILPPNPVVPPSPVHQPGPGDPDPWWRRWAVLGVLGAIGGLLGGYLFGLLFSVDYATAAGILLTFAGSFVGARLVADIGGAVIPMGSSRGG
jgi:hypothetical protein